MQVATMGGSSQYVIAALVLVCLLRKAEAQSECRCIRVMCLAAEAASLCSAVSLRILGCMQVYLFLQLYLVILKTPLQS